MQKQSEGRASIDVSVKKPKVVQLNKGLIIGLVGVIVLVFALIIVNSYAKQNAKSANAGPGPLDVPPSVQKPDQARLNQLPQGYQNIEQIDGILKRSLGTEAPSPAILQELATLKSAQSALMDQVAALKQAGAGQPTGGASERNIEADHSAIFFAGSAPIASAEEKAAADAKKDDKKGAASDNKPATFPDEYQSQNMQAQKMDFLNAKPSKDIYNQNGVQFPVSKFIVQAGTVIPAVLQTEIVSSLPGMITAVVSQNVYDSITGQYLIIPKGSKLLGQYNSQVSYGQEELQAKFVRVIRPDGSSITLGEGSSGVDQKGVSGFSDSVNNHWGSVIGSAVLMTVFNIPSIMATNQMNQSCSDNGNGTCSPSLGSTAMASSLQSAGQSVQQVGSSLANKSLNIQPTITIHPGYEFSVMVTKDTILPPYHTPMQVIPEILE